MWIFFLITFLTIFINPIHADEASSSSQQPQDVVQAVTSSITLVPTAVPEDPKVKLFEQYKKDYFYQRDIFQKNLLTYTEKKQQFTKYGTITTQKDKLDATKIALVSRNNMLRAYLMALRVKLDYYKNSNSTETEKNQIKLSSLESWLQEQNQILLSINNETDLKKWAESFKTKYITIQQTTYTALVQNEVNLRTQTLNKVKSLALDIQNDSIIPQEGKEWFTNIPIKSDLITSSLDNALNSTKKQQTNYKYFDFYPTASFEINKANGYILELNNSLKAIITKFAK